MIVVVEKRGTYLMDLASETWYDLDGPSANRWSPGVCAVKNTIFCYGGGLCMGRFEDIIYLTIKLNDDGSVADVPTRWSRVAPKELGYCS